jgi:uncharacterized membrane-anchored protein
MHRLLIVLSILLMCAGVARAQQTNDTNDIVRQVNALGWVDGPATSPTVGDASIVIPAGYSFLGGPDTAKFMTLSQNPAPATTENLVAPMDLSWFAILSYSADGYVKDDEPIDADALLDSITRGTEAGNAERRKNGWAELHVTGWRRPPHYDTVTRRLEWALDATDGTDVTTNFQTRILGRYGVTAATLVTDPQHLDADIAAFQKVIAGYDFAAGGHYAEYEQGDRVAEYGLAALIAGGAAAVAAKTGLLAKFGKLIAIGGFALVAGVIGFFKKLFRRRTS